MKKLIILLLLSGCMASYQPNLAKKPIDMTRYEADRSYCIDDAHQRSYNAAMAHDNINSKIGAVAGPLGVLAMGYEEKPDTNPDYYKSQSQMADECMAKRGYKIAN